MKTLGRARGKGHIIQLSPTLFNNLQINKICHHILWNLGQSNTQLTYVDTDVIVTPTMLVWQEGILGMQLEDGCWCTCPQDHSLPCT